MGTTTNLDLPYPDGSLPIGEANLHQQALAEAVDDELTQYAKLARVTTQSLLDATITQVQWTAADSELTADFDLVTASATDDTLKYLGPPRFVVWRYGIKLPNSLSSGVIAGIFRHRTLGTLGSDNYVAMNKDAADMSTSSPYGDSGLVWMDTNSEWELLVTHTTGATRACQFWASFKAV